MEGVYTLQEHGDAMEKAHAEWIIAHFKPYQDVWSIYIGNKGNDTKADILGYPTCRNRKRQEFSEYTYTVLQSVILLNRLYTNKLFVAKGRLSLKEFLDLQDALLLFFTHLGRIRDNIKHAAECLLLIDSNKVTNILDEFYHKRHLFVHGKTIPIRLKSNGEPVLPILSSDGLDSTGWNHKNNMWDDTAQLETQTIEVTVMQLFWDLLGKLQHIFALFSEKIKDELSKNKYQLQFSYFNSYEIKNFGSGSSA